MCARCLQCVRKVSGRPRLDGFGPIWPWKILGNVCMLSILCVEGVWKVHLSCLTSTCGVSGRRVGPYWLVSGGCLTGVWRVSERCLEGLWSMSTMCPKGVWKAQIGQVQPNLALKDIG